MIITMRPLEDDESLLTSPVAWRRWGLSLALALGLQSGILAVLTWQGAFLAVRPVVTEPVEAGGDVSVVLLSRDPGEPLRPARLAMPVVTAVSPSSPPPVARPSLPVETLPAVAATPVPSPVQPPAESVAVEEAGHTAVATAATVAGGAGEGNSGPEIVAAATGPGSGTAPASVAGSGAGNGDGSRLTPQAARHPWFGQLKAWLQRHKTYPAALRKAKQQGTVEVTFTISRRGELLSAAVARSSGVAALDQAALDMLRRASPMPVIPAELGLERLTLTIPVEFSLITR